MASQPAPHRSLRAAAVLAVLGILPVPGAKADASFIAAVEKMRAGQALTPDEAALYSTEIQRLMGKLANGRRLTPDEQAELNVLARAGSAPIPVEGGSRP
jgi:hypothetical protein